MTTERGGWPVIGSQQTAQPPSSTTAVGAPLRVVVADDSAAMRTLVGHSLSTRRGFAVVGQAANGVEALALAESQQPDCVVLDVQMPVMGGMEALERLQQRFPSVPVVMLCGALSEDLRTAVHEAGAAAALDKSNGVSELPATVRRVSTRSLELAPRNPGTDPPALAAPDAYTSPPGTTPPEPSSDPTEELRRLEYAVSHDLGEPLRIMAGFSRLLRDRYSETLDDSGQAFLVHITEAADRMQSMFDDLLTYSRAGKAEAHPQPVDLTQPARLLCAELSAHAAPKHVTYSVENLPRFVADPEKFLAALRTLLTNAIVFNKNEAQEVRITGLLDGDTAVLTIEDNGIGFAAKDAERVFGLFQRLNTREEFPGNGMGLSLCRRLLAQQGGSVRLHSVPGVGTRATLTMPTRTYHHHGGTS